MLIQKKWNFEPFCPCSMKFGFHCQLTWNKISYYLMMIFISYYFTMETSSTHVISSLPWVNTFLFHKKRNLNMKTFWYWVHVISWNKKTLKKTGKSTHVWVIWSKIFANKIYGKEDSDAGPPCCELGWKAPLSVIFLCLLNESILV